MRSVAVIGGGAAGLMAAIAAARVGASVVLLEASDRVGRKILRTGNGRCNLTNMRMEPAAFNAPSFVEPVLNACGPDAVREAFRQIGLLTAEEREGRVYPRSNSANSVLDCLRLGCEVLGVEVLCGFEAVDIERRAGKLCVLSAAGELRKADAVIVATGGGTSLLEACGHGMAAFKPVLCALKTQTDMFRGLSGVRVHAQVSAYDRMDSQRPYAVESGEVLFRDYGLSGICVFDLSRVVEPGHVLALDLLPDMETPELVAELQRRYEAMTSCAAERAGAHAPSYEDVLTGIFHPRVNLGVLRTARLRPSGDASPDGFAAIAAVAKRWQTKVTGLADPKNAQVTRGGALVEEFDAATLASRRVPGVYAAGEALNVDGRCGGYNLHWAWASGTVAGRSAALG